MLEMLYDKLVEYSSKEMRQLNRWAKKEVNGFRSI